MNIQDYFYFSGLEMLGFKVARVSCGVTRSEIIPVDARGPYIDLQLHTTVRSICDIIAGFPPPRPFFFLIF
jgi:hypothetical protein